MDTIAIICDMMADFYKGGKKFHIEKEDIGRIVTAPAWIRETNVFAYLMGIGKLRYPVDGTEMASAGGSAQSSSEDQKGQEGAKESEPEASVTPKRSSRKKAGTE